MSPVFSGILDLILWEDFMSKPFKTLRQQIRILRDRNLKIKHGGFTQNILSKENYYCIINGYKEIYLDKSQSIEKYENNVTFEHVYSLYNFDRELRNLFLRKLLKLENYTKTKVAYHFTETHNGSLDYFNVNNYDFNDQNPVQDVYKKQKVTELITNISNTIQKGMKNKEKNTISHYLKSYGYVPLWVLVKHMTFGHISNFYSCLELPIKNKITKEMSLSYKKEYPNYQNKIQPVTSEALEKILRFCNICRNKCAHDERFYNFILKTKAPNNPLHIVNQIKFNGTLFDLSIVLKVFLSKEEYKFFITSLSSLLTILQKEQLQNKYDEILNAMGFPVNWYNELISI